MRAIALLLVLAGLGAGDWAPLFNGQDLSGWVAVGGALDCWAWQDGKVVCKGGKGGWLCTQEQYGDFEIDLDYNCPPNGNSGVFIRAPREGHTSKVGMEIQILDDDAPMHKDIKAVQHTASIYGVVPPARAAQRKAGEWNSLHIRCKGDQVTVTLNGIQVVDADMSAFEDLKSRPRKGFIGLQNHGSGLEFRNVRLKILD